MPSSYTSSICDGTLTDLTTFALRLARVIGDEDHPVPYDTHSHHEKRIAEVNRRLTKLRKMTAKQKRSAAEREYREQITEWRNQVKEIEAVTNRLVTMLGKVVAWLTEMGRTALIPLKRNTPSRKL